MAETAGAADEEHRHRRESRHDGRVVSGPAHHPQRRMAKSTRRHLQMVAKARVGAHGGMLFRLLNVERDATTAPDLFGPAKQHTDGFQPHLVFGVAHVETEPHQAGNDVHRSGSHRKRADRRPQSASGTSQRFARHDELGGGGQSVVPHLHRRRAGVAGLPREAQPAARLANDCLDDAQRPTGVLEHRPLFDVRFEIRENPARRMGGLGDARGIKAEVAHRRRERQAGGIRPIPQLRLETAAQRPTPDVGSAEANPLLLAKADDLDGKRQTSSAECLCDGNAEENAEDAVVLAGVRDRIEMRADQQDRRRCALAWAEADEIADRIPAHLESGRAHPAADALVHRAHAGARERTRDPARLLTVASNLLATCEDLGGEIGNSVVRPLAHASPCHGVGLDVTITCSFSQDAVDAPLPPRTADCMRDHVLFYVNGKRHEVRGAAVFDSLTDFLRRELMLNGTKVVCAEGDCGACTVLAGRPHGSVLRYETVDACIQFLYQLDGKHVVTIEGLPAAGPAELHPVQRAMVEQHGSQCGFCTPGFVMALAGMFEEASGADRCARQIALTGNLCRCTGYVPILDAADAVEPATLPSLAAHYAPADVAAELLSRVATPVLIRHGERTFHSPRSLADALAFKAQHPETVIVSGGTELGVLRNKKAIDPPTLMSLAHVPGLGEIRRAGSSVTLGANVTWRQMEAFAKETLPELYGIVIRFGSPQIRNVATVIANVAHGSPIADSLPLLCVMDAELDLQSVRGARRVKVNGFYRGYKKKDLAPDEIITHLRLPLPAPDELLKLYKVSRRNDLDIATFGAGIRVRRSGDVIGGASLAFTGVGPTVVRLPATESFLAGRRFAEETFREAGRLARREIEPITDVRGSRDFRLLLAENILSKFYLDCTNHAAHGAV